jgi:hypothetical protein
MTQRTTLDPVVARKLRKTREWARDGKRRLYRRTVIPARIDVYFAIKRVYRGVQQLPLVGVVATGGMRVVHRARALLKGRAS